MRLVQGQYLHAESRMFLFSGALAVVLALGLLVVRWVN